MNGDENLQLLHFGIELTSIKLRTFRCLSSHDCKFNNKNKNEYKSGEQAIYHQNGISVVKSKANKTTNCLTSDTRQLATACSTSKVAQDL